MPLLELRMSFADPAALARELDSNFRHGRAFVLGAGGVEALVDCVLVLVHPADGREFGLRGQVVMVSDAEPMRGVGIQLRPFDANVLRMIQAFIDGDPGAVGTAEPSKPEPPATPAPEPAAQSATASDDGGDDGDAEPPQLNEVDHDDELAAASGSQREDELAADADAAMFGDGDADRDSYPTAEPSDTSGDGDDIADLLGEGAEDEDDSCGPSDRQRGPARHERLRKLSVTQQQKLARFGELNDRVLLERIYGKAVWDTLLQNPKLTLPEVALIARKGSAPRPLIEQIVDNNAWIQSPLVRRALLTNPRVSGEGILKLLRITPRPELKVICKTTTYSTQVREAARKVLES